MSRRESRSLLHPETPRSFRQTSLPPPLRWRNSRGATTRKELGSVRSSLQTNKSLFEEKDPTITTLTAEVDQWKLADAPKAKQFAAEHHDKEKFQRDLAAFSSQTADLQKRYDAQSKDIVAA
jgi:hypothetical protein